MDRGFGFLETMTKRTKRRVVLGVTSFLAICLAGTMFSIVRLSVFTPRLFERIVTYPIPESVHKITADRCQISSLLERLDGFRGYAYVLRFDISRDDLSQIIVRRGFKPWENVQYSHGILRYKDPNGYNTNVELYVHGRSEPTWFDLAEWRDFRTYYVGEEGVNLSWVDVDLLLYNEQLACAYLVKHKVTGL